MSQSTIPTTDTQVQPNNITDAEIRQCMELMDEKAVGNPSGYRADYRVARDFGGSIWDGDSNTDTGVNCRDLLNADLTPSQVRNMLGNASFRASTGN